MDSSWNGSNLRLGALTVAGALVLAMLGIYLTTFWLYVTTVGLAWIVIGCGANVIMGTAGMAALHSAGTMAIAGYGLAISLDRGLSYGPAFVVALLAGTTISTALLLPALRLDGFYLAIASFIAVLLIQSVANQWRSLTGGPFGLAVRGPVIGELSAADSLYLVVATAAVVATLGFSILGRSVLGARFRATRDSPTGASSIGISHGAVRFQALVAGNLVVSAGGALFASASRYIDPTHFGLTTILSTILVVWVGGLDQTAAPILGALLVSVVANVSSSLQQKSTLFTYGLLFVVLLVRPNGLITLVTRNRSREVLR